MLKVLVLCTGNSCRSIMAEALLNQKGLGRIKAVSAGSHPTGYVHPMSLATLVSHGITSEGYTSKSWDLFAKTSFDVVITVCDNAAGESCPIFYGAPIKAHWGVSDPVHIHGTQKELEAAFSHVFLMLEKRVKMLLALPFEEMDKAIFSNHLKNIGSL